jgi:CheY-like chemotaxis protein
MQELRARGVARGIALSGYTEDHDARASAHAGFDRHLNKPVLFADLLAAIQEVTGWHPPEQAASHAAWREID